VYALLADGTTVEIRPATPDDFDAVKALHAAMSPDDAYMRFFNISRVAAEVPLRCIPTTRTPRGGDDVRRHGVGTGLTRTPGATGARLVPGAPTARGRR